MWKEDLLGHRCSVFLAEKDSIINSPMVREYLERDASMNGNGNGSCIVRDQQKVKSESALKVVWCSGLDHGQVFDLQDWRNRLKKEVLMEARQLKKIS